MSDFETYFNENMQALGVPTLNSLNMSERNLTSGEISMLRTVFGNSIDYTKITLDNRVIPKSFGTTYQRILSR